MDVLRLSYRKGCSYMFQNFSRATALKFQSALTFRWQHVMWGELVGLLHPHPSVSRPCVLVCLCLILLLTTVPCIPPRHWLLFSCHSQTAGTYPGTKRLLQELEMLWLVHGQHDFAGFLTRRSDFFPSFISRMSGVRQLPRGGADALLLFRTCAMPLSTLKWETVRFWQARTSLSTS